MVFIISFFIFFTGAMVKTPDGEEEEETRDGPGEEREGLEPRLRDEPAGCGQEWVAR